MNISYSEFAESEARFRELAFHIAYNGPYALVKDCTLRFAYALQHSIQPIQNRQVLRAWWAWSRGRTISATLKSGKPIPAILKPIVQAYVNGVAKREGIDEATEDFRNEQLLECA